MFFLKILNYQNAPLEFTDLVPILNGNVISPNKTLLLLNGAQHLTFFAVYIKMIAKYFVIQSSLKELKMNDFLQRELARLKHRELINHCRITKLRKCQTCELKASAKLCLGCQFVQIGLKIMGNSSSRAKELARNFVELSIRGAR